MPLTAYERGMLLEHGIDISSCSKPLEIVHQGRRVKGLRIARLMLPKGKAPRPENFVVNQKEPPVFREFEVVISAIGNRPKLAIAQAAGVFYAGDLVLGSSTVVESVASGKNAALEADAVAGAPVGRAVPEVKDPSLFTFLSVGIPAASRTMR